MFSKSSFNPVAAFGRVSKALTIPAIFALLAGCSSYEKLPEQSFDTKYKVFSALSFTGKADYFFIKPYEFEGKLAMCGGYTRGGSNFATIGSRRWADISQIYVDGSKIGNADFMIEMPVYGLEPGRDPKEMWLELVTKKPATRCVKSDVDWNPKLLKAKFERKGPNSITVFD